jgi:phenylalanyl-tRNA synthetase alpha chain
MADIGYIAETLSQDELDVLSRLLREDIKVFSALLGELNWEHVRLARNLLWLENKSLVETYKREEKKYNLTELGEEYLKRGLPEHQLFDFLSRRGSIKIDDITNKLSFNEKEEKISIGILKKYDLVEIHKRNSATYLGLVEDDDSRIKEVEAVLEGISSKQSKNGKFIVELVRRGLVEETTVKEKIISLTALGKDVYKKSSEIGTLIGTLNRDIIENELWKTKKFKKYDIKAPVPSMTGNRKHPLYYVLDLVRDTFVSMGFTEVKGPWIETAFWNMDSMFIPQDHPARDVQDTFYLEGKGELPENDLIEKIKMLHSNGWDTGSTGYGMDWDEEIARQLLMRTHTTAVSYRSFYKGIKKPIKIFCIDKVFRNETPDRLHLPEFHQIEGFVVADGLNLRHLMGYLKQFYNSLGIKKLKFKPTYNPYTEPSMEVFCYYPRLGWVEVGNSGIFRPEAMRPYGLEENVVAWGLALERLAAIIFDKENIRDLIGHTVDLGFIRTYPYRELDL